MSTQKIAITFPKTLVKQVKRKAELKYGIKFPELVRHLLMDFVDEEDLDFLSKDEELSLDKAMKDIRLGDTITVNLDKIDDVL